MNTEVFKSNFSKTLLAWYNTEKRKLPFRESKDPYKVWLSEIADSLFNIIRESNDRLLIKDLDNFLTN